MRSPVRVSLHSDISNQSQIFDKFQFRGQGDMPYILSLIKLVFISHVAEIEMKCQRFNLFCGNEKNAGGDPSCSQILFLITGWKGRTRF